MLFFHDYQQYLQTILPDFPGQKEPGIMYIMVLLIHS